MYTDGAISSIGKGIIPQETEDPLFNKFLQNFERLNQEQAVNLERLIGMSHKLHQATPTPHKEIQMPKKERLTSGEGLLSHLETMLIKYDEMVGIQSNVLREMEKLI